MSNVNHHARRRELSQALHESCGTLVDVGFVGHEVGHGVGGGDFAAEDSVRVWVRIAEKIPILGVCRGPDTVPT